MPVNVIDRPGSAHAALHLGRRGVARTDTAFTQLMLLNAVLGDSFHSRLNMQLREEMGISYGAWSMLEGNRHAGLIALGTSVRADNVGNAIEAIKRICHEMSTTPPAEEEIAAARNSMIGRHAMARETTEDIADLISHLVLYDLPLDHYSRAARGWLNITSPEISALADSFFNPESFVIVAAGEERTIRNNL
jgi:zinc protease